MTTITLRATSAPTPRTHSARAEWTKVRTLRATWITLTVAVVASVLLGVLNAASQVSGWDEMSPAERADFDATSVSLVGVLLGTLVLGAIAVRSVAGEYSSGMVRVTFAAVPQRRQVLRAKGIILFVTSFVAALVANTVAFVTAQQILATKELDVSVSDTGAVRAIVFGAVGVGLFAVIAVSLGVLLRKASPANILLALIVIGGQILSSALPDAADRYMPSSALKSIVSVVRTPDTIGPAVALASLATYAAVLYLAASTVLSRRDA